MGIRPFCENAGYHGGFPWGVGVSGKSWATRWRSWSAAASIVEGFLTSGVELEFREGVVLDTDRVVPQKFILNQGCATIFLTSEL